jgi:OOP family OmpA-OmpF porin
MIHQKGTLKMKTKLINLAVASAFAFTASASFAEEAYSGSWYLMPTIGVMNADSDLDADDNDASYGIRLGKEISEHWDVQLGVTHAKSDIDFDGVTRDGDYKQTLVGVDALYMFSRDKFRPFLLAGIGAARNSVDGLDFFGSRVDEDQWSWMANVGAGFQYLFNETVGMQADLRHVWSRAEGPNGVNPVQPFSSEKTVGNTYLNLGLIINFAAPKKVVMAEPMAAPIEPQMDEVAAYDDEEYPFTIDESVPEEPVVYGPEKPAFEKITLAAEVLFAFDKDALKDEGKQILDVEVIEKMKAHPEVELVLITGHTDRIGDDKYNQRLSDRRANQVKQYIASQGVAESRLHAVGKGEKEPVVDCKGVYGKKAIECLQPNRRVVVEVEVQRVVEK